MKKSTKKLVSVLLASAMAAGMLAGCGSGNGKGSTGDSKSSSAASGTSGDNLSADTSEHVDLTMYLIGDRTPDFDEVYAKINEILEEKLNCSLNVEFLSWGEHDTKYSLLFSSQEDFDLIFTASSWCQNFLTKLVGIARNHVDLSVNLCLLPCHFRNNLPDIRCIRFDKVLRKR